jgi:hypothetical protein
MAFCRLREDSDFLGGEQVAELGCRVGDQGELPGGAQASMSRLPGALRMTRGSCVSLVVRMTRRPSATAGSSGKCPK